MTMKTNYERLYLRVLIQLDDTVSALQARAIGCDFIKESLDEAILKIEHAKVLLKCRLYQNWSSPPKEDYPPELDDLPDDESEIDHGQFMSIVEGIYRDMDEDDEDYGEGEPDYDCVIEEGDWM